MEGKPGMRDEAASRPDAFWRYGGYRLEGPGLATALAHLYRGELQRSNIWRTRLDATTNWAVVTAGGALTLLFGSPENPPLLLILVLMLLLVFLVIEARRYRYYELWAYRVRLMETDFYAPMLVPPHAPSEEWAGRLSDSLLNPEFTISFWEALGRRFRRNYAWVFAIVGMAWWLKVLIHPTSAAGLSDVLQRAAVGPISGQVVIGLGIAFYLALALLGLLTWTLHESTAEVFEPLPKTWRRLLPQPTKPMESEARPKYAGTGRPARRVAITIVTNRGVEIGKEIVDELGRGVTRLPAEGLYSGEPRDVLLCSVAPHDIARLKKILSKIDASATLTINPMEDVAGGTFIPV